MRSSKNEEDRHNLPICEMGDFEKVLRTKNLRYENIKVPALSDIENEEISRPYFGNPFKLLQTQTERSQSNQSIT